MKCRISHRAKRAPKTVSAHYNHVVAFAKA